MTQMNDHGKILKYFETKFRFVANCFFYNKISFCFVSPQQTSFRTFLLFTALAGSFKMLSNMGDFECMLS